MKQTQATSIADQAADWVVKVHSGEMDAEQKARFDAWCAADAAHREAYEKELAFWQQLSGWKPAFDALETVNQPLPEQASATVIQLKPRAGKSLKQAFAAAASLALLLTGLFWLQQPTADYTSSVGEVQTLSLPDGSTLMLNTGSAVRLDYTATARNIHLLRGEAWVDVQQDTQRPLRVYARSGYTEAVGTAFNVLLRSDHTQITVTQGQVKVAAPLELSRYQSLSAGYQLNYRKGEAPDEPLRRNTEEVIAWTQGWLEINNLPLKDALTELNRYLPGRIILVSSITERNQVSGIFRINRLEEALHALAATQNLKVQQVSPWITLVY